MKLRRLHLWCSVLCAVAAGYYFGSVGLATVGVVGFVGVVVVAVVARQRDKINS